MMYKHQVHSAKGRTEGRVRDQEEFEISWGRDWSKGRTGASGIRLTLEISLRMSSRNHSGSLHLLFWKWVHSMWMGRDGLKQKPVLILAFEF